MQVQQKTLYEMDFNLWVSDTAAKLKAQNYQQLDWENLLEEVASLGRSQRNTVRSLLRRLLEHLLKRCYVEIPECHMSWQREIRAFRNDLQGELEDSPSLKNFVLEILPKTYTVALAAVIEEYPHTSFPDRLPFPMDVDALLIDRFWEA